MFNKFELIIGLKIIDIVKKDSNISNVKPEEILLAVQASPSIGKMIAAKIIEQRTLAENRRQMDQTLGQAEEASKNSPY